jgi:hypothetical protein
MQDDGELKDVELKNVKFQELIIRAFLVFVMIFLFLKILFF